MEKKYFDLTTRVGKDVAIDYIKYGPVGVAVHLVKNIMSSNATKEQGNVVKQLIESGKSQGVDEMEIRMKNVKGIDFSVPIDGVDIKAMAGSKEDMIIKVKYK